MYPYDPITVARFWSKVLVTKGLEDCWEWQGATKNKGYGRIKVNGKSLTASRIAWELYHGQPLGDLFALHTCDNPRCCNPTHIVAGTNHENVKQAIERGLWVFPKVAGEENGMARLSHADVIVIKARLAAGETVTRVAADFPVSYAMVWNIQKGKSWRSIPWPNEAGTN